jgi:translation initiation factor eIF-2B subunit delta
MGMRGMTDSGSLQARLAEIAADRTHGAAELAAMMLDAMAAACAGWVDETADERRKQLRELVDCIHRLRPSMAALTNWAIAFHDAMAAVVDTDGTAWADHATASARKLRAQQTDFLARQTEAARARLADARQILTLSWSSTVTHVLLRAAPNACTVIVAESRPLLEGRKTVRALNEASRSVRMITDAQVGLAMAQMDLLLIGADTICGDRAAVNKVGSYPAALAAREASVPMLVAADSFKIDPTTAADAVALEEMPGDEIWPAHAELCRNVYFEPVPASLIAAYITELGVLPPDDLIPTIDAWRSRYRALGLV